jgi:hypothetical protein
LTGAKDVEHPSENITLKVFAKDVMGNSIALLFGAKITKSVLIAILLNARMLRMDFVEGVMRYPIKLLERNLFVNVVAGSQLQFIEANLKNLDKGIGLELRGQKQNFIRPNSVVKVSKGRKIPVTVYSAKIILLMDIKLLRRQET